MKKLETMNPVQVDFDKRMARIMQTGTRAEALIAFDKIRERYAEPLFYFASRFFGKNREDKEDAMQEVFTKIFSNIGSYNHSTVLTTWMYALAKNQMIDIKRRKKFETNSIEDFQPSDSNDDFENFTFELEDRSYDIMKQIEKNERARLLTEAVNNIKNENAKQIIVLIFFEETPYEDVSKQLGLPLGTVKTLMHRAKQEMKAFISKKKNEFEYGRICKKKEIEQKEEQEEVEFDQLIADYSNSPFE